MEYNAKQLRKLIVRSHPFNEYWTVDQFRTVIAITDMVGDDGSRTFMNEGEFTAWAERIIDWYDLEAVTEDSADAYVTQMLMDMDGRYLADVRKPDYAYLTVRLIGGTDEAIK